MGRPKSESREQSIRLRRKTYNGAPCQFGHGTKRYVCNHYCVVCQRDRFRRGRPLSNREVGELRAEARERGDLFFMGNPCQRGHVGRRYVSTKQCVDCRREDRRAAELRRAAEGELPKHMPKPKPKPEPYKLDLNPEPDKMGWQAEWGRFKDDPRACLRDYTKYVPRHPMVDAA